MNVVVVALGVVTAIGLVVLWPRHDVTRDFANVGLVRDLHAASVTGISRGLCTGVPETGRPVYCDKIRFELEGGPDRGEKRSIQFADAPNKPTFSIGEQVILSHTPDAPVGFDYQYADRQRRPVLLWLTAIFAVAVIALGRWRGVGALVGLGASIFVVLQFVVPAMLEGSSPPVVAIVGASTIAFCALYLANGIKSMTTVALLSTLAALAITVALATAFTELAHFSGAVDEEALLLTFSSSNIDLKGLVLAGMVLGALGALDDVTVTQASAVAELRINNGRATRRELYRSGVRVGRDHVASTVNTLALAYAGASLPILILFSVSGRSLGAVANGEIVATAIISALVGSIGLVCAVPIATGLAVLVTGDAPSGQEPAAVPDRRRRRRWRWRWRRRRSAEPPSQPEPVPNVLEPRDPDSFWS